MNVKEIVKQYLKEHGFDGLTDEEDCACVIGDLMPCGGVDCLIDCVPGHHLPCACTDDDHAFHIGVREQP